jgi:endonuclease/exonuclease/phosphatase family metal-dependent hydrolase
LKVVSWNLLRVTGAGVYDVAKLIEGETPDLLLLQEATSEMEALPEMVGGNFHREPLPRRIHGLAAWSPHPLPPPVVLPLPVSRMPGRVPPRIAQILRLGDVTFANVHLSHGQLLNRWQLIRVAEALEGPAAVIGDYNAVGPTVIPGFRDVGPREATHVAIDLVRFRLDRCLVRLLKCTKAMTLEKGRSDHRPIALELSAA